MEYLQRFLLASTVLLFMEWAVISIYTLLTLNHLGFTNIPTVRIQPVSVNQTILEEDELIEDEEENRRQFQAGRFQVFDKFI